jgi:polygalacturonase
MPQCHFSDFSILKGGHFGLLLTGVDNLTIDSLTIDTDRDGIDLDSCKNVHVSNSPWDDGICPNSSYALGYARPTENVTITGCTVTGDYQLGSVLDGSYKIFPSGENIYGTGRIKCGDRIEWRIQKHHDHKLRLRGLQQPFARE